MTIADTLIEPMEAHDVFRSKGERMDRAAEIMKKVGMEASLSRITRKNSSPLLQRIVWRISAASSIIGAGWQRRFWVGWVLLPWAMSSMVSPNRRTDKL